MTQQTFSHCGRRQFLYLTAAMASSALGMPRRSLGEPSAAPAEPPLHSVTQTSAALGTKVSITALHADREKAAEGIEAAFAELALVERLMSIYQPDSQLSRLNRDRSLADPHACLVEVLRAAEEMSRLSQGAFDITVQPLWSLFAAAQKAGRLPDASAIESARQCVDWRQVEVSLEQIILRGKATITLNGIAQGYAADRAAAALSRHGVCQALIDTGEMSSLGTKAGGQEWIVGVQHPRQANAFVSLAKLAGRCLATSGDYATSFSDDHRHNHLFDPRTGRSPTEFCSVSIAAATALQADALSTAVFVLGPERGLALIDDTPGADALLVLKSGEVRVTNGFPVHGNDNDARG